MARIKTIDCEDIESKLREIRRDLTVDCHENAETEDLIVRLTKGSRSLRHEFTLDEYEDGDWLTPVLVKMERFP